MIQILRLLFFTAFCFTSLQSQSLYFKTGKNFTNYVFESSSSGISSSVVKLQPDSGSFYELGAVVSFGSSRFSYEYGISLNELNSIVETPSKAVKYKTEFIGLDNSVLFSLLKTKKILWDSKLGFGLQTMIFGKQEIGGTLYDLKKFDEFNGLFLRQSLGTQIKLVVSNQFNFSIGYDYYYNLYNTKSSSNQTLKINNSQIKFGVYYLFEKTNKVQKGKIGQNVDSLSNVSNSNSKLLTNGSGNSKNQRLLSQLVNGTNQSDLLSSGLNRNAISTPLLNASNTNNFQSANDSKRINLNGQPVSLANATNNKVQSTVAPSRFSRNTIVSQSFSNTSNNSTSSDNLSNRMSKNVIPIQNDIDITKSTNTNLRNENDKQFGTNSIYAIDNLQTNSNLGTLDNQLKKAASSPEGFKKKETTQAINAEMTISPNNNSFNSGEQKKESGMNMNNSNLPKKKYTSRGKKSSSNSTKTKKKINLNEISNRLKKVEKKVNIIEKQHGIK